MKGDGEFFLANVEFVEQGTSRFSGANLTNYNPCSGSGLDPNLIWSVDHDPDSAKSMDFVKPDPKPKPVSANIIFPDCVPLQKSYRIQLRIDSFLSEIKSSGSRFTRLPPK